MLAAGVAYVPEDREKQGLVAALSLRLDVAVTVLDRLARWGVLRRTREVGLALRTIASLAIRTDGTEAVVSSLSGVGVAAGLVNGVLVVGFGLPSLAVTLGTMSAYRALALCFGGQEGHAEFPAAYIWLGSSTLFGALPVSLLLLAAIFALLAFVLHGTVFGRLLYMIGANALAMRFSGIRVGVVKVAAFAAAGSIAGLAALVYVGQFESARADNAGEILLFVVAAVTLGGVDVFGGRGHVAGVFLALLLLGTIKNGMGLANLPGPVQTLIVGALLVGSVAIPQAARLTWPARRTAMAVAANYAGRSRPVIARHEAREEEQ